jgi:hypothetical protein
MSCAVCEKFPVPTSKFEELGVSEVRHGTLYSCKQCGAFIEIIAEERSARLLSQSEAERHYPATASNEQEA